MNNDHVVTIPNLASAKRTCLARHVNPLVCLWSIKVWPLVGIGGAWVGHWVGIGGHCGRGNNMLARRVGNCNNILVIYASSPASPLQINGFSMVGQSFGGANWLGHGLGGVLGKAWVEIGGVLWGHWGTLGADFGSLGGRVIK